MLKRRFYKVYINNSYCSPEWFHVFAASKHCRRILQKKRDAHRSSIRMQIRQKWPDHDHPNIKHSGLMTNQKVKIRL